MSFQFKNIESGYIYKINEIDEIAAKFWGKDVHPKEYAYPGKGDAWVHNPNWFDIIGIAIENCQYMKTKWGNNPNNEWDMDKVASMILFQNTLYACSTAEKIKMVEFLRPYIDLCYHLMSLKITGIACGW